MFAYILSIALLLFYSNVLVESQIVHTTLFLNKTVTWNNRQLYGDYFHINKTSTLQVDFAEINPNVSFIVFQVHSHIYNVTVYYDNMLLETQETGTNIGFYSQIQPIPDIYFIRNLNNFDLILYIAVLGYVAKDPIPGGCNMEFPIPISPFVRVKDYNDYVFVDAAPAQGYLDSRCLHVNTVTVKFYRMFLPERNFDANFYFNGIVNMMTLDKIRENGEEIPNTGGNMRRMLSAYPGTGSIYVAVAYDSDSNYYSVYSPSYTYGCTPIDDGCDLLDDLLSRFICASLLFIGLFVCCFGHRFFKTEMFLFGLISGVVITYILISLIADLDRSALVAASLLSGVFFGAIWYIFWWFYGIPVIAVLLPALNLGFLAAAIFYFKLPGGLLILQEDFNFWSLFIFIMLFSSLLLVSVTFASNILCCAVLGAYAIVYPMDYYFGSNLKYIIINTIRRAVVPKFNMAVISPPFEWRDALVTVIWVVMAMGGFLFQLYHNHGRPPFPPPPRSISPRMPEPIVYGAIVNGGRWRTPGSTQNEAQPTNSTERTPLLA